MYKLKYKQLLNFPRGKYHDGKGLYTSISCQGMGKWSYCYCIDNKSREMGPGTFPETSIVDARQKAEDNKRLVLHNIDPIEDKRREEVLRNQQIKSSLILGIYILQQKKGRMEKSKERAAMAYYN